MHSELRPPRLLLAREARFSDAAPADTPAQQRLDRVVLEHPLQLRHLRRHVLPLELVLVQEEVGHDAREELQPARLLLELALDALLVLDDLDVLGREEGGVVLLQEDERGAGVGVGAVAEAVAVAGGGWWQRLGGREAGGRGGAAPAS